MMHGHPGWPSVQRALVAASTMTGTLMVSRIVTPSLTRQHD
jgi:hypothetical protein